ncbi:MAG TPA: ABC transporter ATP-binding protein, partial [Tianweitania sediminis]|nr:ABC transporter ATP-binding protein [Tianweitania sediminis]
LIVLDEAVSALDVSVRAEILHLLKRLQRETRVAYLFITHDLGVVRAIADRVAVLDDGRIVEHGSAQEIIATPQSPTAQALVAAVPRLRLQAQ